MVQRLPSLNALRAFEAVARHLSISRAAEELNVTPAAVSQQVKALEADLGAPLLRRVRRKLYLTDAGRAGVADLRAGFDRLIRAARRMRGDGERQLLTLRVEPTLAAFWLVSRLEGFRRARPGIDLRLDASLELPDFDRDGIEMAIHYGDGAYPGLEAIRLFVEEVFPVCSPRLLDGPHPLRRPADLREHTLLHLDWHPRYGEWPDWAMWLRAAGAGDVDAERGPRFSEQTMSLQAAEEGQGVALGSTALVADDIASGRLVQPFALHLTTNLAAYLVYPKDMADEPRVAAFRHWITGEAERSQAGAQAY